MIDSADLPPSSFQKTGVKMSPKIFRFYTAVFVLGAFLAACGSSQGSPTATTDPNLVYTASAQTADARLTELVALTPSVTPQPPTYTPNPLQTFAAQTAAAMLTQAASLTPTPPATLPSTLPPTGSTGDLANWVMDVTIPDHTVVAPGQTFVKTWRIQNDGTSTWTTDYDLVFIDGQQMGTVTETPLTTTVSPGQQVDISVSLTAPTANGAYTGYWKMRNTAGAYFNYSVTVVIDVGSTGPTATTGPGTATVTPTQGGNPISNLSMSVDPPTYIGACPFVFTFSANFTLNQNATLTYVLEAGSDTPGFNFNLPPAQTQPFTAGTYGLSFPLEFTSSGTGWVRLHITAPVDMTSNQATFTITCQP
jgi:hypothetical protein